jgi:hypothetical protein
MDEAGSLSNLYIDDEIGRDAWGESGVDTVDPSAMTLAERLARRDDEIKSLRAALEDTSDELRQLRGVTLRKRIAFSGVSSIGEGVTVQRRQGQARSPSCSGWGDLPRSVATPHHTRTPRA